jgi:hypothetical protein
LGEGVEWIGEERRGEERRGEERRREDGEGRREDLPKDEENHVGGFGVARILHEGGLEAEGESGLGLPPEVGLQQVGVESQEGLEDLLIKDIDGHAGNLSLSRRVNKEY